MPAYRIYRDEVQLTSAAQSASAKVIKVLVKTDGIFVETSSDIDATEQAAVRDAILAAERKIEGLA